MSGEIRQNVTQSKAEPEFKDFQKALISVTAYPAIWTLTQASSVVKVGILLVDGSFDLRHMTRDFWLDHRQSVQNGTRKLVVHLSHNSVRRYYACILLGLEFMRHSCIYHGNLITISTRRLCEKIGEASHQLDALRYAAMLEFCTATIFDTSAFSHAFNCRRPQAQGRVCLHLSKVSPHGRRAWDPKLCDCHNFGALVRYIRNKIVTKEAMRRILESLQPSWMEADLCLLVSRILEAEEEKILGAGVDAQRQPTGRLFARLQQFIDPV
uniref:Protein kinase domain-containing protein n=1 Tax=Macrostomum lignano TaxID=282301 RepID=A0A1I8FKA2_9PLAT